MRILLDTYYLYELMTAPHQFGETERRFFDEHEAQLHVSAVSIWEMRLKYYTRRASGERKSSFAPSDVVAALEGLGVIFLTVTERHAARELESSIPQKEFFRRASARAGSGRRLEAAHYGSTDHRTLAGHCGIAASTAWTHRR